MNILALSDLHIGKEDTFGERIIEQAVAIPADVLYFGGDLAEPSPENPTLGWQHFTRGLELLAQSPAKTKLFTLGNNDLEQRRTTRLTEHYDELNDVLRSYGFHLLDKEPCIVDEVGFVGNVGWFDGSLWEKVNGETSFPNDAEEIRKVVHQYFTNHPFLGKNFSDLTSQKFYEHCRTRITNHLTTLTDDAQVKAIVAGIHHVPSSAFVRSDSARFAFSNWYMGATSHATHYQHPKVALGFTGHTHRSETRLIGNVAVHNISGTHQPRLFELFLDAQQQYCAKERWR